MNKPLHEEMWASEYEQMDKNTLEQDEHLSLLVHYKIADKKDQTKNQIHVIWSVVRKGDKAEFRTTSCHTNGVGYCKGHTARIATYPIEDVKTLVEEAREYAIQMGEGLEEDEDSTQGVHKKTPVMFMKMPDNATNEGVFANLMANKEQSIEQPRQVIINVLGLVEFLPKDIKESFKRLQSTSPNLINEIASEVKTQKEQPFNIAPVDNTKKKPGNNLKRAAEEMELIQKYGKKEMQKLAKKMNYKGAVINKRAKAQK